MRNIIANDQLYYFFWMGGGVVYRLSEIHSDWREGGALATTEPISHHEVMSSPWIQPEAAGTDLITINVPYSVVQTGSGAHSGFTCVLPRCRYALTFYSQPAGAVGHSLSSDGVLSCVVRRSQRITAASSSHCNYVMTKHH